MPHATIVEEFPKTALSRRTGDVLAAAATGPVCLTDHGKPRFVLMTMAQFERLSGRTDSPFAGRTGDLSPEEESLLLAALDERMCDI
ncbi:type II toxin-antitoxin system prevent-host-death family antitoxin (plasmid) [Cereibacter azotoformans]|uniref:Antitoxin n=1 Tax=Cereibacter sphaeroides (strain ATCC 17025 / ATH 2.4.3) TaxID=349102 RepID=A4WZZ7_CERS5|nr:type II toxin-antitoxin system prevent-host-death family antitoxin [Cereibacter azotoformans]ULB12137.1 type II toxin-antitoxin system prevent-host-death family antitoxin [Cereibacter azotoformans]